MKLPIELVLNTDPPRFRWKQTIDLIGGEREIEHIGVVPAHLEGALIALIEVAQRQAKDIEQLKKDRDQWKEESRIKAARDEVREKASAPVPTRPKPK